ncbi:hypothetical protein NIES22_24820 [Calothrix brevissima NIES-22]|nr:hypothetical protein NIES22_24820 [Calothrix brevissima NIES-22]
MKPLLKNLVPPLRSTFLTLLLTAPQIPLGSLSSQKTVAQAQNVTCPANTRLQNLNWENLNFQTANFNQTFNIGGVNINFRMVENPSGFIRDVSPGALGPIPFGIEPGPYGGINKPYLRWGIDARGRSQGTATLTITADKPVVLPSSLLFLDVDRNRSDETGYQDQITVTASNAGANVPVTLVRANGNVPSVTEVVGNVARGQNPRVEPGNAPPESSAGNVAATFAGPVTSVQIVYQSGPLFAPPNPGPGQDETIGLATDIGVCVPAASIGDTVFSDRNGNNAQDPGEPGIPGVAVEVRDSNGNVVGNATTDNNGQYRVSNLLAGQYTASVPQAPNGLTPTLTQPNPITLTAGQNYDLADFGFRPPANSSIGDTVFNDPNGNSVQDQGETGIPNVQLQLRDGNANVIATTTTDNNGKYSFGNLVAGQYTVVVSQPPSGLTPTLTQPNPINLAIGQNYEQADFGFRPATNGSIGDTVFNDPNNNNVQDQNELGIPNVQLQLKDGNGNVIATTTTDNNGKYSFGNLAAGQYTVVVSQPPNGLVPTLTQPNPINLTAGQNYEQADFGFRAVNNGSIGDTVFNDPNGNNIQDQGETGIANVQLQLRDSNGNVIATTVTDDNGKYNFINLVAGQYTVVVSQPPTGLIPTLTQPNPINLTTGQNYEQADFGFRAVNNGTIGDTVFNDPNGNSVQDQGETGIANVQLQLRDSNGNVIATTTTDNNGKYNFNNLVAGQYTVRVSQPPSGLTPTLTQPNPINLTAGQNYEQADFGFRRPGTGAGGDGNIFLVKRITAIARSNAPTTQFNTFVDDPNDSNDNTFNSTAVGVFDVSPNGQNGGGVVQSGDEVEYTIYFRTEQSLENINLCDLIPTGTTYVANSISVTGGGVGADQGRFFPPLTPIEQIPESNVCENRNNPNGTVIVKLGNIPTTQSGFVRFRVRIN